MDGATAKKVWGKARHIVHLDELSPGARRILVGVLGGTVLLIGIAMMILPGPAIVVIPLGLAILGSEFMWARRWMNKARGLVKKGKTAVTGK